MDNAKSSISKSNLAIMKELYLKLTAHLPFRPDIAFSDFFLFDWQKIELASRPIAEIDNFFILWRQFYALSRLRQSPAFFQLDQKIETNY
jgi:hypothetical protein